MSGLGITDSVYEEMFGGKWVAMSPRPLTNHDTVAENIFNIFKNHLKGRRCLALAERNVYFDDENIFIPDVMILCDRDKRSYRGIEGAPDLVVEVLSRSTQSKDRRQKKAVYERYGVREYWLVSVDERAVEVYLPEDGVLTLDKVYVCYPEREIVLMTQEDREQLVKEFAVSFMPNLKIALDEIFEDLI